MPSKTWSRKPRPAEVRFWKKVNKTEGCWLWTAAWMRGYGKFWSGERLVPAHRWAYEAEVGPIPEGLQLDHLCRNKRCVRPDHLEVVTGAENTRRALAGIHKSHCPKGHPYSGDNLQRWSNGAARCRACNRDRYYRTYPLPSGKRKPRRAA